MRTFELLGIVLFRFRLLPRLWVMLLMLVNVGAVAFLDTIYGQLSLASVLAAVVIMAVLYAKLGFVRLLGIAHIFWFPMLIWFAFNLPDRSAQPWLYYWVTVLMVIDVISLVIDTYDVARYIGGDRQPYYAWKRDLTG